MFKALRERKNKTQREIETALGLANSTVSKWENGICQPQIEQIPKLAKALGVSVEEVVACFEKQN